MNKILKIFASAIVFLAFFNMPYATATEHDIVQHAPQSSWAVFSKYVSSPSTMFNKARQWLPSWNNFGRKVYYCQCVLRDFSPMLLAAYLMQSANAQTTDVASLIKQYKGDLQLRINQQSGANFKIVMNNKHENRREYDYDNERWLNFKTFPGFGDTNINDTNKIKAAIEIINNEIIPNLQLSLPRQVSQIDRYFTRHFNLDQSSDREELMDVRRNFDHIVFYWQHLDLTFSVFNFHTASPGHGFSHTPVRLRSNYPGINLNLVHLRNAPIYETAFALFHESAHDASGYIYNSMRSYVSPRIFSFLPDSPIFAMTNAVASRSFYRINRDYLDLVTFVRIDDYSYDVENFAAIGLDAVWNAQSYASYAFNLLRMNAPLTEQQLYNYQMMDLYSEVRSVIFYSSVRERLLGEYAEQAINYFVQRYGGQLSPYYRSLMRNELIQIWQRTRMYLNLPNV